MLAHAYIFYGPDELAKKGVALKFANKILNPFDKLKVNAEQSRSVNADFNFNPDLILISADTDEERSINSIRQLKKFLILSPYYGSYKIAVIDAAEKLNIYAQNALLKIFEEAPNHAIIILCAKTIDSIPETIASRGVKLPFWRQNNIEPSADFVTPKADFVQPKADFVTPKADFVQPKEDFVQPKGDEKNTENFNEIFDGNLKDPYYMVEKFNDYAAIEIFKLWLWYLRTKFLFDPTQKLNNLLKVSQNIYFKLNETNVNPRFAYDELIINLQLTTNN